MCDSESSCSRATATTSTAPAAAGDVQDTYTVAGMTCGGCANTVTTRVSGIAGVTGVRVDVAGGALTIISDTPIDFAAVRATVEQAGYQLVG